VRCSGGKWLKARRLPPQVRLNNAKAVKDLEAGILPGIPNKGLGNPRNMPISKDSSKTAEDFAVRLFGGEKINKKPLPGGGWVAARKDGTAVTYRPAGRASHRTPKDMATVEANSPHINIINARKNGKPERLKLKFPNL